MTFEQFCEKVKAENERSKAKYGPWSEIPDSEQMKAIHCEFQEWVAAWMGDDIHGEHGEIAELTQVANLCFRRIQFLMGVEGA